MFDKIKLQFDELSKGDANWEDTISRYFNDEDEGEDTESINLFFKIINDICDLIRENGDDYNEWESFVPSKVQQIAQRLIDNRLRPYRACAFFRKIEEDGSIPLEYLIDDIWQNRIICHNPTYTIDAKKIIRCDIEDAVLKEFVVTLNAIVDHCIYRLLNYDAILETIQDQMGISKKYSEYIARKIYRDYSELRINYLIKRITMLSD